MEKWGLSNDLIGAHEKSPDYLQPIRAYRVWSWRKKQPEAVNSKTAWDTTMQATCQRNLAAVIKQKEYLKDHPENKTKLGTITHDKASIDNIYNWSSHEAPHHNCSCGLYGFFSMKQALDYSEQVVGLCEYWGRAEIHEEGIRSQFCSIKAMAPCSLEIKRKDFFLFSLFLGLGFLVLALAFLLIAGASLLFGQSGFWIGASILYGWLLLAFILFCGLILINHLASVKRLRLLEQELKGWCNAKGVVYCKNSRQLRKI